MRKDTPKTPVDAEGFPDEPTRLETERQVPRTASDGALEGAAPPQGLGEGFVDALEDFAAELSGRLGPFTSSAASPLPSDDGDLELSAEPQPLGPLLGASAAAPARPAAGEGLASPSRVDEDFYDDVEIESSLGPQREPLATERVRATAAPDAPAAPAAPAESVATLTAQADGEAQPNGDAEARESELPESGSAQPPAAWLVLPVVAGWDVAPTLALPENGTPVTASRSDACEAAALLAREAAGEKEDVRAAALLYEAGRLLLATGDDRGAVESYQRAQERDAELLLPLAAERIVALRSGDWQRALELATRETVLTAPEEQPALALLRSELQAKLGKRDLARAAAREASASGGLVASLFFAELLAVEGRLPDAAAALERAAGQVPEPAWCDALRFVVGALFEDTEKARARSAYARVMGEGSLPGEAPVAAAARLAEARLEESGGGLVAAGSRSWLGVSVALGRSWLSPLLALRALSLPAGEGEQGSSLAAATAVEPGGDRELGALLAQRYAGCAAARQDAVGAAAWLGALASNCGEPDLAADTASAEAAFHLLAGQHEAALAACDRALSIRHDDPVVEELRSAVRARLGLLEEAIANEGTGVQGSTGSTEEERRLLASPLSAGTDQNAAARAREGLEAALARAARPAAETGRASSIRRMESLRRRARASGDQPLEVEAVRSVSSSEPVEEAARNALCAALLAAVDPAKAGEHLGRARELASHEAHTHLLATLTAAAAGGGASAALADCYRALAAGATAGARAYASLQVAQLLLGAGPRDGAEAATALTVLDVVAAAPDLALDLTRAARRCAALAGRSERVARELGRRAEDAESSPAQRAAAAIRAAEAALASGLPDEAVTHLRGAGVLGDHPSARAALRIALYRARSWGALADEALRQLASVDEGNVAARVAAYEELAAVDTEGRGDLPSAILALESLVEVAPRHHATLHRLERYYAGAQRSLELASVWERLAGALEAPEDRVPILMERARLRERAGELASTVRGDLRAAGAALPSFHPALLRLLATALEGGDHEEAAGIFSQLAESTPGDLSTCAVLLCHAGDALIAAERLDEAGRAYAGAAAADPRHLPAQIARLRLALRGSSFEEAAEAARCEGEASRVAATRCARLLLAGALYEERLAEPGKAIECYERAIAADARSTTAFTRLRALYREAGRSAELAKLLAARIELETEHERVLELRLELGALQRDALHDLPAAREQFQGALDLFPRHPGALEALADLAEAGGDFQLTAGVLARRTEVEKEPAILQSLFLRLGRLHVRQVPDVKRAMSALNRVVKADPRHAEALGLLADLYEREGDARNALGALLRLVDVESDAPRRTRLLLRAAHLFEEGLGDPQRAEDALRRALEIAPLQLECMEALAAFYERRKDTRGLRVHLDRSLARIRGHLASDPYAADALKTLRALFHRRGDRAGEVSAAQLLAATGRASEDEHALARTVLRAPKGAQMIQPEHLESLFVPPVSSGVRNLCRLLSETLARRFPVDPKTFGASRGDRLSREDHPLRAAASAASADFDVAAVDVYVSSQQPTALVIEPGSPPWIVVGASLAEGASAEELRFLLGRLFLLYATGTAVASRLDPRSLGIALAAAVRQQVPDFSPASVELGAVAEETQRMAKALQRKVAVEMMPFALEISGQALNPGEIAAGLARSANHAALLYTGHVYAGMKALLRLGGEAARPPSPDGMIAACRANPWIADLVLFAVSDEHMALHRQLELPG